MSNNHLDLDVLRARRAEARADLEPPTFSLAGETFTLPAKLDEVPIEAAKHFAVGDVLGGVDLLLGPEDGARLKALGLTLGDIEALGDFLMEQYELGELPASPRS